MKIKIIKDELIYDGQFIQLIRRHFFDKDGQTQVWETVRRKTFGRVIGIAAITPKKEIILEKIFRVPCNEYVLELPAGLMDKQGEDEETAVRRELLEETGYAVDEIKPLINGPINTGLMGDEIAIYLGINARMIKEPTLESSEDIEVIKMPIDNLAEYISKNQNSLKIDLKVAAVLPFLQ